MKPGSPFQGHRPPSPSPSGGIPPIFARGAGGILPERGSDLQKDLVTSLVSSAMQSAGNSGSPLLAALTPLLGGAALSRVQGLHASTREGQVADQFRSVFGRDLSETERQLLAVAENENAPGFLRERAESRLEQALRAATGGSGRGGGGSTSSPNPQSQTTTTAADLFSGGLDGNPMLTSAELQATLQVLRDPDATSQSRQYAMDLLEAHREAVGDTDGDPAAPTGIIDQAPARLSSPAVPSAAPARPGMLERLLSSPPPEAPPPPPGTVPY